METNQEIQTQITLIDLIDNINHYDQSYRENSQSDFLELKRKSISELSSRIKLSMPATALFSVIIFNSLRGNYLTKAEAVTILENERSIILNEGLWEILRSEFVRSYRDVWRKPETRYFTTVEIEEQIIKNIVPVQKVKTPPKKRLSITVVKYETCCDYQLMFEERVIGTIYFSIVDHFSYTAVIGDSIIANDDSIDLLVQKLNAMYHERKLAI